MKFYVFREIEIKNPTRELEILQKVGKVARIEKQPANDKDPRGDYAGNGESIGMIIGAIRCDSCAFQGAYTYQRGLGLAD